MKKLTLPALGSTALVCGLAFASLSIPAHADSKMKMGGMPSKAAKAASKTVYTCPMHPEVVLLKPGKCPVCKMALTKKK